MSKSRLFISLLVTAAGLVVLGCMTMLLWPHPVVSILEKQLPDVLFTVQTHQPVVALTIDDGPDPATTPLILDVLAQHGAAATFFVITDQIARNEELITRIVAAGHELGNHMTRDESSARLSPSGFTMELRRAYEVLARYDDIRWFRPGGGWLNKSMVDAARQAGYSTVLGSVYPMDTAIPSARFAAWYIRKHVRPGSVIVLHDRGARGRRTAAALDIVLPELRRRGYSVTTLSDLAGIGGSGRVR